MNKTVSALLGGLVAALTLAMFVASSVAAREIQPVATRVTRLEAQREASDRRLDEIGADVKAILRELRTEPRPIRGVR
jgi:hypothetical protein